MNKGIKITYEPFFPVLIPIVIMLTTCINSECKNIIIEEKPAPNNQIKAVAFIRDCGTTTDKSPQVSIIDINSKLNNEGGNIFIGNHSQYIKIYWETNNSIFIIHNCNDNDIFKMIKNFKDINITYRKDNKR